VSALFFLVRNIHAGFEAEMLEKPHGYCVNVFSHRIHEGGSKAGMSAADNLNIATTQLASESSA
jgi:hypothetical protein